MTKKHIGIFITVLFTVIPGLIWYFDVFTGVDLPDYLFGRQSANIAEKTSNQPSTTISNETDTKNNETISNTTPTATLTTTSSSTTSNSELTVNTEVENNQLPKITLPKSTYSGSNTAVFARAYFGRESTPAYTNEEVVFVEYVMTGWTSGNVWLHFMDASTGEDVYYFGPVPEWCKTSLIAKYEFVENHSYVLFFTDSNGNLVSDSSITLLYKPGNATIFYPNDSSRSVPSYSTNNYNNYGDGDTRYIHKAYYELN
ncbi:hypothetical protein [Acetobacterium wieringae]|uniref:hypothetical protein n=1 Tax=Acetobacterium wieringae TaxID=52694 RepID=UPI00315814ED